MEKNISNFLVDYISLKTRFLAFAIRLGIGEM